LIDFFSSSSSPRRPDAGDFGEQATQTTGAVETGPWILRGKEGGRRKKEERGLRRKRF